MEGEEELNLRLFITAALAASLTLGATSCAVSNLSSNTDCNETAAERLKVEGERVIATRVSQFPTPEQMLKLIQAYQDFRSFIRGLDIPEVETEQRALLVALENYLVSMNTYLESDGSDLEVNDAAIPLRDATEDFVNALVTECGI